MINSCFGREEGTLFVSITTLLPLSLSPSARLSVMVCRPPNTGLYDAVHMIIVFFRFSLFDYFLSLFLFHLGEITPKPAITYKNHGQKESAFIERPPNSFHSVYCIVEGRN